MTSGLIERSECYISKPLTKNRNPNWKKSYYFRFSCATLKI